MKTFYLKVIKDNSLVFQTQNYTLINKHISPFVKTFKSTIRKDCQVILHEVVVQTGISIEDWQEKIQL